MSRPHQYLPGTFYEVTRRCVERAHKLTPDYARGGKYASTVEHLYKYATARFAKRYGIEVMAVCLMANHMHEILFDRRGKIDKFLQKRNAMFANMVKVRYGLPRGVFEKCEGKYNRLEGARPFANLADLADLDDERDASEGAGDGGAKGGPTSTGHVLVEKISYVLANPVAAGLVASPEEWPGFVSSAEDLLGTSVVVKRPLEYLAQNDAKNAPKVQFTMAAPPEAIAQFANSGAMVEAIAAALQRRIRSARRRHAQRFAGRLRVLATSPRARATSYEPFGRRVPRFTTAGDLEAARRLIAEMRAFRKAYRIALEAVKAGKRRVTFPAGTGKMHSVYGFPREAYPVTAAA
jgi:REP element-mobilizing transposase RayT